MSSAADVAKAAEAGDAASLLQRFPAYLEEYRKEVVPEKQLAGVKAARFDKWLRLLGSKEEKWLGYTAAALVDFRMADPEMCKAGTMVNAMLFSVLAEAMPPDEMIRQMRITQIEGTSIFKATNLPKPSSPAGLLNSLSGKAKEQAVAQDHLMRAWFHGLFLGGRGVYDDYLKNTLRAMTSEQTAALKDDPNMDEERREQLQNQIHSARNMLFPHEDLAARPPLTELPLLGVDIGYEDFAQAVVDSRFYTIFTLDESASQFARQLLVLEGIERGQIDPSALSSDLMEGSTPARLARQSAFMLSLHLLPPVVQALWAHANIVEDGTALDRLADIASRWHLHGKREVVVRGSLPPGLESLGKQMYLPHETSPIFRLPPEVPTPEAPMETLQLNPLGLGVVVAGGPGDGITPFTEPWATEDNVEDAASFAASRHAAYSFVVSAPRYGDLVGEFLAQDVSSNLRSFHPENEPLPDMVQFFEDDPGFGAPRSKEDVLKPSTPQQRWAALGGVVAPGCLSILQAFRE